MTVLRRRSKGTAYFRSFASRILPRLSAVRLVCQAIAPAGGQARGKGLGPMPERLFLFGKASMWRLR
eukprot:1598351-Heterocapsa_arctica.AAC.1